MNPLSLMSVSGSIPEPVKALFTLLGFSLALFLFSIIKKKINSSKQDKLSVFVPSDADVPPVQGITLIGTDEKTAAVVMAVVSKNLGVPLEKLRFHSIRLVENPLVLENINDTDAAVVMAVTSHKTGIPLQNLSFSRIALISE